MVVTQHEIPIDAYRFAMNTDGNYLYGGTYDSFFKISLSDWSYETHTVFPTFSESHAVQVNPSRNQFYVAAQSNVNLLAIVDMDDLSSYTTVNVYPYANVLTDDLAFYDNGTVCKVYVGGELSGSVSVNITDSNSLEAINIDPTYGLFLKGTTIYSPGKYGTIQKFDVSNPSSITTYTLDSGFVPNEILFVNDRMFVTHWGSLTTAKLCEYLC
jgi:hypothetical protein